MLRKKDHSVPWLSWALASDTSATESRYELDEGTLELPELFDEHLRAVLGIIIEAASIKAQALADRDISEHLTSHVERVRRVLKGELASGWSSETRARMKWVFASDLYLLGTKSPSRTSLEEAVALYRELSVDLFEREGKSTNWARIQSNLGGTLGSLGDFEGEISCLKKAVAACQEADTGEDGPILALIQSNLGSVLAAQKNTAHLIEAVAAFHEALNGLEPRDRFPARRAEIRNMLVTALRDLGNRLWDEGKSEAGNARMAELVAALQDDLEETPEHFEDWVTTKTNIGIALFELGSRQEGAAHLEKAIATFQEAIERLPPKPRKRFLDPRVPIQIRLADTLSILGARTHNAEHLKNALGHHLGAHKAAVSKAPDLAKRAILGAQQDSERLKSLEAELVPSNGAGSGA